MKIRVHGEAYGETYDYECELVERNEQMILLHTISDPPHEIRGTVRHVGIELGKPAYDGGPIILNIRFDGEFVALGRYEEHQGEIQIFIHEW